MGMEKYENMEDKSQLDIDTDTLTVQEYIDYPILDHLESMSEYIDIDTLAEIFINSLFSQYN